MTEASLVPFTPGMDAWPDPDLSILGDNLPEAPEPPLGCLTAPWAQWVEDAAKGKACPVDFVLGGLIASAAAILSGARKAVPWEGWTDGHPILWCALVGNPSSGKSPALDTVLGPLREIEDRWSGEFEDELRRHVEAVERAHAAKDQWRESLKKATKDGGIVPELPIDAMEPDEPQRSRLVTGDTTIEKVALILSGNKGRGVLSYRDELSGWLMNFERHGGSDRAFWVECYGGRPYTQDRVKHSKPIQVDCLGVSVIGGIQPDRLRSFTIKNDDDGMAARFLFFYPEGSPPFERPKRSADPELIAQAFSRLAALESSVGDDGRRFPSGVPLSTSAANMLEEWRRDVLPQHERMSRGLLLSALGKLPGVIVRLSLVFEYLAWAVDPDRPEPETVSASAVDAAITFAEEYALPMARRALVAGSQPREAKDAALVAQWLLDTRPERVNLRDLRRLPGFPVSDPHALDAAAPVLVDAGFWRPVETHTGGRPRKDYEVSPRLPFVKAAKSAKSPSDVAETRSFDSFDGFGRDNPDIERSSTQAVDGGAE